MKEPQKSENKVAKPYQNKSMCLQLKHKMITHLLYKSSWEIEDKYEKELKNNEMNNFEVVIY